jgi:hypothetical protein
MGLEPTTTGITIRDSNQLSYAHRRGRIITNLLRNGAARGPAETTNSPPWTACSGAPGRNRTCDLRLRRPLLYPTELRAQEHRCESRGTRYENHPFFSNLVPRPSSLSSWSGQRDLNPRHPAPKAGALPGCAMPRKLPLHRAVCPHKPSCGAGPEPPPAEARFRSAPPRDGRGGVGAQLYAPGENASMQRRRLATPPRACDHRPHAITSTFHSPGTSH